MLSRILTINRHLRKFSTLNVPQLVELGIKNDKIKYNLSYEQLLTDEVYNKEGHIFTPLNI